MPSTTPPANATGLPTRRTALLGSLAGLGAVVSLPRAAKAEPPSDALSALWHQRLVACGAMSAARHRYDEAAAQLPWWACSGPRLIDREGRFCGEESFHPAIEGMEPPSSGDYRVVRPGPLDFEKEHAIYSGVWGEQASQKRLEGQMAAYHARIAAKHAEEERLGLGALGETSNKAIDVVSDLETALLALPGYTPDMLAAVTMLETIAGCYVHDTANKASAVGIGVVVLTRLRPHLTGEIAEDAAEFIDNADREMQHMRVSAGIDAVGGRVAL